MKLPIVALLACFVSLFACGQQAADVVENPKAVVLDAGTPGPEQEADAAPLRTTLAEAGADAAKAYLPANIRGYGHSIVYGGAASVIGKTNFFPLIRDALDPSVYTLTYLGRPSQNTAQLIPQAGDDVDAYIDESKCNILAYMEVINSISHYSYDLGYSGPKAAAATIADYKTLLSPRRKAGWDGIIVYTMYPVFYYSEEIRAAEEVVNQWIRDAVGAGIIDGVVDVARNDRFTVTGPPGVSTTVADSTHPNDLGHKAIAEDSIPVFRQVYEAKCAR